MEPRSGRTAWSPALLDAAANLRVDGVTAEVFSALRKAGLQPILLKGPSIAAWLYADGTPRPYGDTDLLVAPETLRSASQVVRAAGFREQPSAVASYTWARRSDGSVVDLHDSLFGAMCTPAEQWSSLSRRVETMRVGGIDVDVLSRPARLLHVVLHAAQHGSDGFERPLTDLARALSLETEDCWEQAARLAERLEAMPVFATGLSLHPAGARRAAVMGQSGHRPLIVALQARGAPAYVVTLERLANTRGLVARAKFLAKRLAPPPDYMRWVYPNLAGRGPAGLLLAYAWRPLSMAWKLPAAIAAWRRARRTSAT